MTDLFFVYEPEQVPLIAERLTSSRNPLVIGLTAEAELELAARAVPFTSIMSLAESPEGKREMLEFTRSLAREWYTAPETSFFTHDSIALGEPHEVLVLYYLQALMYFFSLCSQALDNIRDVGRIIVPESLLHVPATADPTARFKERLPLDVLGLLAGQRNIPFESIAAPTLRRGGNRLKLLKEQAAQRLYRLIVAASNGVISLRRHRAARLLLTDPWTRVAPFLAHLPDAEIVMTRRSEMRIMGLRKIWRARARFHHRLDFANWRARALGREKRRACMAQWERVSQQVGERFAYEGVSFWPVAKPVFDAIIEDSYDAVATIESAKRALARERITCVLLFSSTKGYHNTLARVAEKMDIPSIELQHALESTEPTFVHSRLPARYLAAYGPLTRTHYQHFGIDPSRVVPVGSPRFDVYAQPPQPEKIDQLKNSLALDHNKLNVLVIVTARYLALEHGAFTGYAIRRMHEDLAAAQKHDPDLRYVIKLRPGKTREWIYRRAETLARYPGEIRIAQNEPLHELVPACDIVIIGSTSTTTVEAMQMGRPVIVYLPRLIDNDFKDYEDAGAVLVARTPEQLRAHLAYVKDARNRKALVARAHTFLRDNFMLDGNSAERVAALIRRVQR